MAIQLQDTFTGANGTNLTAHTMNVGSGWTQRLSVIDGTSVPFNIQSNKAQQSATGFYEVVTADAGVSDGTLSCDISVPSGANWLGGIIVRWFATGDYFLVSLEKDGTGNGYMAIYEEAASVLTSRGTVNFVSDPASTIVTITIVISGVNITATTNTGEMISYGSATAHQTSTLMGLWGYNDGTTYTPAMFMDNFLFTTASTFWTMALV